MALWITLVHLRSSGVKQIAQIILWMKVEHWVGNGMNSSFLKKEKREGAEKDSRERITVTAVHQPQCLSSPTPPRKKQRETYHLLETALWNEKRHLEWSMNSSNRNPSKPDRTANQLELVTYYPFWSSKFRCIWAAMNHMQGKQTVQMSKQMWEGRTGKDTSTVISEKSKKRKCIKSILVNVCAYKS